MEQNRLKRLWQHLWCPRWYVERHFPTVDLQKISVDIGLSEQKHQGQIRFVVESRYPFYAVMNKLQPHIRALQWFGELGIWDTEFNSGVLIYVSFADKVVEIIADRGVNAFVSQNQWNQICRIISEDFKQEKFVSGLEKGLKEVDTLLITHFPRSENLEIKDDLDNDVVIV